jgi:hypothetical protein
MPSAWWVKYEADVSAPGMQYGASLSPVQKAGLPPSAVQEAATVGQTEIDKFWSRMPAGAK